MQALHARALLIAIDLYSEAPQNGQRMYPSRDGTANYRIMNSLALYVKGSIAKFAIIN